MKHSFYRNLFYLIISFLFLLFWLYLSTDYKEKNSNAYIVSIILLLFFYYIAIPYLYKLSNI